MRLLVRFSNSMNNLYLGCQLLNSFTNRIEFRAKNVLFFQCAGQSSNDIIWSCIEDMDKGLYDDVDEICQAVHYRLSRKVLPRITEDGYVEYGLQIPHNYQTRAASISVQIPSSKSKTEFGPDVEWILRGSGSTSRGSAGSVHQSLGTVFVGTHF